MKISTEVYIVLFTTVTLCGLISALQLWSFIGLLLMIGILGTILIIALAVLFAVTRKILNRFGGVNVCEE